MEIYPSNEDNLLFALLLLSRTSVTEQEHRDNIPGWCWSLFQKHALEEHKFSLFYCCAAQERMWKGSREERNWTIQKNFLLFFQSLFLIAVLKGNALGQIFNWENGRSAACWFWMPQHRTVVLLRSIRIKQLFAQVRVYTNLPLIFQKHHIAELLSWNAKNM